MYSNREEKEEEVEAIAMRIVAVSGSRSVERGVEEERGFVDLAGHSYHRPNGEGQE